jgi:protein-S-isoprenylcysteine O-methyltransferase Ste14
MDEKPSPIRQVLRTILRTILGTGIFVAILFAPAGRLDWTAGWAFFAASVIGMTTARIWMGRRDPELLRERTEHRAGAEGWDRVSLQIYSLLLTAMLVTASLDAGRFEWSTPPPVAVLVGWVLFVGGGAVGWWALASNTFASVAVRIQTERGHRVISAGPYRFVRHPMYVGILLATPGIALLLGSLWALLPAAGIGVLFVIRTALEDRTLRRELDGYEEFARRVPYLLVPRIW